MTELVYVPKRLAIAWMKKGWNPVDPINERDWAVLMAPPKENKDAVKNKEASKINGGSSAFSLLCEKGGGAG
jgi:hypothetical protein